MVDYKKIPIAKPLLGEAEAEAARRVVLSGWVSQGPEVARFEEEFADYVGATHACAVSNCTVALTFALLASGVGPGDEVVTVSHSFIATANSIRHVGAVPVFVDIQADTYNIDPAQVRNAMTPKTAAILCVHQMGMPCDLAVLKSIASSAGVPLIEDAACAIGSEIKFEQQWRKIGAPIGDFACFSFHPRKVITTGEGGMITSSNQALDRKVRLLRQHGMSISDLTRHASKQVEFEEYLELGFNGRMTDIQAAIGRVQLKKCPEMVKERRVLATRYSEAFQAPSGLRPQFESPWARSNWQSYCVRLGESRTQIRVMQFLLDRGISTRRGIMCAHLEHPYMTQHKGFDIDLGQSEKARDESVLLPLYNGLSFEDQDQVICMLKQAIGDLRA